LRERMCGATIRGRSLGAASRGVTYYSASLEGAEQVSARSVRQRGTIWRSIGKTTARESFALRRIES
jgi:hypothetical protein